MKLPGCGRHLGMLHTPRNAVDFHMLIKILTNAPQKADGAFRMAQWFRLLCFVIG
ncbi:MAG TPA: hypothetical protein VLJ79_01520 [Candidatus Binatia bacterium]|nr:hypothetical protein [Candidatus Binatia bacterium]